MGDAQKLVTETGDKVGYNFAFSSDLGSGKLIQVTGVFNTGATTEQMNAEFDKIRRALDRQVAKSATPAIEDELSKIERTIAGLTEDLNNAEERFKGKTLPTQEAAAHHNIQVSLRDLAAKRDSVSKLLEKTRAEAE